VHEETEHLYEVAAVYKARLKVLELQVAKLGTHCPAHIHLEIQDTQQELSSIEDRISGKLRPPQGSLSLPRSPPSHAENTIWFILIGAFVVSTLVYVVLLTVSNNPVYGKEPSPVAPQHNLPRWTEEGIGSETSEYPNNAAIECTPTAIHELGVVVWENSELDKAVSLPIGTRVSFICYSPQIGRVGVILIRLPIEVNHERRVLWVIETYRCLDEQRVSSYPDPERPNR
jgi:hypothetical protein